MNQLSKNVIENCRLLVLIFSRHLPFYTSDTAKKYLIDTLPNDVYRYIDRKLSNKFPKEGELSLEQIKGLAECFAVPIDFLIDDKIVTILTRLLDIEKELRNMRATITTLHFSTNKNNINPAIEDLFLNEYRSLKEVIFNETNTR